MARPVPASHAGTPHVRSRPVAVSLGSPAARWPSSLPSGRPGESTAAQHRPGPAGEPHLTRLRAAVPDGTPSRVAAFFDLDKTIIAGSSTLAFSGPLRERGLIGRRALLRSGYAQLLLMVAGADAEFMERMRERISALCAGWEVAEVRAVIQQALDEILRPMIYAEAAALIDDHRRKGHHVVVVSASGEEMVEPIAAALSADHCAATRMMVVDGRYTGEIDFYCYGEGKALAARALAERYGYQLADCYAYSDSITDLPLLQLVGNPRAVNPDRALRRIARAHGWPVLRFVAPIPLHVRFGSRVRSLLPARAVPVAAALGAVALLVLLLNARRFGRRPRIDRTSAHARAFGRCRRPPTPPPADAAARRQPPTPPPDADVTGR